MNLAGKQPLIEYYSRQAWWGEYLAQYMFAARKVRGQKVLDLGCSFGYGTRYLFDAGAVETVGVDFDANKVRIASENWGRDGVTFLCHDGHVDLGKPNEFDITVSFRVLETSRNPDQLLKQIHRMLKSGGTAYISTTNRIFQSRLQETPIYAHHVVEYDVSELEEILKSHFKSVELFGQFCTRMSPLAMLGEKATFLDFIKARVDNYIPWRIRQTMSETLLGVPYYPEESEFVLRKQNIQKAPILYAICKK
jgi:2-polyprenyl-3-methyl-5-hydroxy-6-metoxy-1,4-benzoquinol methylase